jgi:hypothetical protein
MGMAHRHDERCFAALSMTMVGWEKWGWQTGLEKRKMGVAKRKFLDTNTKGEISE